MAALRIGDEVQPYIPERPDSEGVFGPVLYVDTAAGHGCLRHQDGSIDGSIPSRASTNAFLVWVGRRVAVVSSGVDEVNIGAVARGIRELVGDPYLAATFTMPCRDAGLHDAAVSDDPSRGEPRDLARALAYVLVQAAWLESNPVRVELDGARYELTLRMVAQPDGRMMPRIE